MVLHVWRELQIQVQPFERAPVLSWSRPKQFTHLRSVAPVPIALGKLSIADLPGRSQGSALLDDTVGIPAHRPADVSQPDKHLYFPLAVAHVCQRPYLSLSMPERSWAIIEHQQRRHLVSILLVKTKPRPLRVAKKLTILSLYLSSSIYRRESTPSIPEAASSNPAQTGDTLEGVSRPTRPAPHATARPENNSRPKKNSPKPTKQAQRHDRTDSTNPPTMRTHEPGKYLYIFAVCKTRPSGMTISGVCLLRRLRYLSIPYIFAPFTLAQYVHRKLRSMQRPEVVARPPTRRVFESSGVHCCWPDRRLLHVHEPDRDQRPRKLPHTRS